MKIIEKILDIIIPTYNREQFLKKNLEILLNYIHSENMIDYVNIIISNNHSSDNTSALINFYSNSNRGLVFCYEQDCNIGLEQNSVFVLSKAKSCYVMYLGDDDYISRNYLKAVIKLISEAKCTAILPNFKNMNLCERINFIDFDNSNIVYLPSGFNNLRRYIGRGHQLSGLVFMREGLLDAYLEHDQFRNIYLFIFFVGYSINRGGFYIVNSPQVHVTAGNTKDWNYGNDGLINQVFCNFSSLFPDNIVKQFLLQIFFIHQQRWRLCIRLFPIKAIKISWFICKAKETTNLLRLLFPFILLWFYASFITRIIIRQVKLWF